MKIFGISIVKNEADIIEHSLTKASEWAHQIFVMDNGSDDGTWEKAKILASQNPKIVAWKQSDELFHDGLRAKVFNQFSHLATDGDWWCARLDADEYYIDNPIQFLSSRVKPFYHVVCSKHIQYRLTDEDLKWEDKNLTIENRLEKLNYFDRIATSEVRFFKHRNRLIWNENKILPEHVGLVCPERILVRHYQYRSLNQIKRRILTRQITRKKYPAIFPHVSSGNPADYLAKAVECVKDSGNIELYNQLPLSNNVNLKYRWWVFWIRRILHATGIFP